ncbi:MAG: sensor histidine kinase [Paracoccaceae bacterium]
MLRLLNSLTGRFLILTVVFVMIAEVLILVPSMARFRLTYLQDRLELAQLAALAVLAAPDDMVSPELADELLSNAEVLNIALRRNAARELVLARTMPRPIDETFDLREPGAWELIVDAATVLFRTEDRIIRIIGVPVKGAGVEIETTIFEMPLKFSMIEYGVRILWLSAFISVVTAALLFFAVRMLIVRPITRVADNMIAYGENPEDAHRIIRPSASATELRKAENALKELQTRLTQSLRQKDRLAALGSAVARISHDLRNILTTGQLLVDRIGMSEDPAVARTAPRLVKSLSRAINLCESTLTFGKAEEPAPELQDCDLGFLVSDVFENDALRVPDGRVELRADIPDALKVRADPEQLQRVLMNLVSNARQAIETGGRPGSVTVSAANTGAEVRIEVRDTGPGLPEKAKEHLFRPFQGGARQGGTGLGLAIAAEIVRGHGGRLELIGTGENGTTFRICLPASGAP